MPAQLALYYPYIHFRDDDWLKASLLFWDLMGRIVPKSFRPELRDSDFVREVRDADDQCIRDYHPEDRDVKPVSAELLSVIDEHADWLRHRLRPIVDTHEWFQGLPLERQETMRAGMNLERQAEVLAAWHARDNG